VSQRCKDYHSTLQVAYNWKLAEYVPFPAVKGALMSGVFQSHITQPTITCPTGNCTWPITPTLGMCSKCTDTKHLIDISEGTSSVNYTLHWLDPLPSGDNVANNTLQLDYTFDGSLVCPVASQISSEQIDEGVLVNGTVNVLRFNFVGIPSTHYDTYTSKYCHSTERDLEIGGGGGVGLTAPINVTEISSYLVATECSYYFCLQAISANATNGEVLYQDPVLTWDQFLPSCSIETGGGDHDDTCFIPREVPEAMNVANTSAYYISTADIPTLSAFFGKLGAGQTQGLRHSTSAGPGPLVTTFNGEFDSSDFTEDSADPFVASFYKASNTTASMSALVKQVADGFTTFMRTTLVTAAPPDSNRYAPVVYSNETIVRVRWAWLTLPLGLLVVGQIFLSVTVWQTQRKAVRPWKDLRLPLLLASVEDSVRVHARNGLKSRMGLEERVGMIEVEVEYDGEDNISFTRV
jgi:hypothetical protein